MNNRGGTDAGVNAYSLFNGASNRRVSAEMRRRAGWGVGTSIEWLPRTNHRRCVTRKFTTAALTVEFEKGLLDGLFR